MPVNLLLIGPPGVGKGTQASLLADRMGIVHLASGDIFRAEISGGTDLGKEAQEYTESGRLVPDEVTIGMMKARIARDDAVECGFILDGFPRTVAQAEALDALLENVGIRLDRVVSIELDDSVVVGRLSGRRICPQCGEVFHLTNRPPLEDGVCDRCSHDLEVRKDDDAETVRRRLQVFHETTQPVIDHYSAQGKLYRVDGSASPEDVYRAVEEVLQA